MDYRVPGPVRVSVWQEAWEKTGMKRLSVGAVEAAARPVRFSGGDGLHLLRSREAV